MNQVSITGMVLSAAPVGDYDRRLVILTKELGKIAAFAKGARRQNSALLSCGQPFAFGNFLVYQGKNSYNIISAEIMNYFEELRMDLDAVYYGLYFCEFADYLTRENVDGCGFLKLLYQSLRALTKKTIPFSLIRYIFEFKMMDLNGEAPQVFECVKCANESPGYFFSVNAGGLICKDCNKDSRAGIILDEATVYTLQFILATQVEKLYTFRVNDAVLEKLQILTKQYLAEYVGHTFHSVCFIDDYITLNN